MKSFSSFLSETMLNDFWIALSEAVNKVKKASGAGSAADTKGKLHELLTGFHLLGGRHMSKHPDIEGDGPEEAYEKLRKKVSPAEHKAIEERARATAADIKSKLPPGHVIHDVHWTSKSGDIERSTGIASTQKEDASDIVIHSKKGGRGKVLYTGASLKVTDSTNHNVPVSNPGMESMYGADAILQEHRDGIKAEYPELGSLTSADARKEAMKNNPKMDSFVRSRNKETLDKIAGHLHDRLSEMTPRQLADHIRTHVLQANPTPMQQAGHGHIRHTTFVKKQARGYKGPAQHDFHSVIPSEEYEHIFKDPKNISFEKRGTAINFSYKGRPIASHRIKFTSQSDPLGGIKGTGTPM